MPTDLMYNGKEPLCLAYKALCTLSATIKMH